MRYIKYILIISVLFLVSCGKQEARINDVRYHPGSDWQFFQTTAWGRYPKVQEDEGGCYFYHDHYVYRYDSASGMITPLCSKANCLHDHETDDQKKMECMRIQIILREKFLADNGSLH